MNLDTIAVSIRPRNPWEAIDIGFILARRWYWKLWLLWVLVAFPSLFLVTGLGFLLPGSTPKLALMFFWFFKPFYEPALLFWISRALFGTRDTIKVTIRDAWKKISWKRLWIIQLHRLTPFRSFSLPVLLLEGLEGKEKSKRLELLKDGYETSVLLTLVGFCIEVLLTLSLMSILYLFIPEELRWVDFGSFIFLPDKWLLLFSYFIACSIFSPFYICAGFMMYISRRVELEAWDIEIGFKRLRQRIRKRKNGFVRTISTLVLFCVFGFSLFPGSGWCNQQDPEQAKTTVTSVLEQKEFGENVVKYRWIPKNKDKPESDSVWTRFWQEVFDSLGEFLDNLSPIIARYSEFILWCCAGMVIFFLLLKYSHLRDWLTGVFASPEIRSPVPEVMFGMDLRPESLPDDIGNTCSKLLRDGKKREAMSLLYRATLSQLVNGYSLPIHTSYTEDECCDAVQKVLSRSEAQFFESLTSLWIFIAYGHKDPDSLTCHELIDQWNGFYGVQS